MKMRYLKIAITALAIFSCFLTLMFYWGYRRYWFDSPRSSSTEDTIIYGTPMRHVPYNQVYKDKGDLFDYYDETFDFLIKTKGCQIPLYEMYEFVNTTQTKHTCDKRAIFLNKIGEEKIKFTVKKDILYQKYLKNAQLSYCCYSFVKRSHRVGNENKRITYTPCNAFKHNDIILLESDFIKIRCYGIIKPNKTVAIYDDIFGFIKKKHIPRKEKKPNGSKFNVLILGIDSMSFYRAILTMPRVTKFMKENYWLAYKGYHKVGDNTYPNLMAALTGLDISSINAACSRGMDHCNDNMIWSEFKKSGYATAYGEDYLRLPDTFSGRNAFHKQPTHHFLRPLFLTGEQEHGNGSLVCSGKASSAQQLLNYAFDFALTYRNESFFGAFWINSHSHNINGSPKDLDKPLENFLFQLSYTHIQGNTFIIFMSDHGIRFGPQRMSIKSYYDERLPALFVWIPPLFRYKYPALYDNAIYNQRKLITPYDLHSTLTEIVNSHSFDETSNDINERKKSQSLFKSISENRTCAEAGIHRKWCSCHKMYELTKLDTEGYKSVILALNFIRNVSEKVQTKLCWGCSKFALKNIIRTHYYYDEDKSNLYHVVAFTVTPGNISYEATVLKKQESTLVWPISVISAYRGLGTCVVHHKNRLYCACQRIDSVKCTVNGSL